MGHKTVTIKMSDYLELLDREFANATKKWRDKYGRLKLMYRRYHLNDWRLEAKDSLWSEFLCLIERDWHVSDFPAADLPEVVVGNYLFNGVFHAKDRWRDWLHIIRPDDVQYPNENDNWQIPRGEDGSPIDLDKAWETFTKQVVIAHNARFALLTFRSIDYA
jgi:hypothetical protein